MSTATKTAPKKTAAPKARKEARKPADLETPAPADSPVPVTAGTAPEAPTTSPAPDIQDPGALRAHLDPVPVPADDAAPLPGTTKTETVEPGDALAVEIERLRAELANTIRRQNRTLVAYMMDRGKIVRAIIDTNYRKARNGETRKKLRATSLRSSDMTALDAFDPAVEAQPNSDRWNRLYALEEAFPEARNLSSVAAALALTELLTRIDPPTRWDEPERWEIKRQYREEAHAIVKRAVDEHWTKDQCEAGLAYLDGAEPVPTKPTKADPIKAARDTAARLVKQINALEINPETLLDELTEQLTKYGWRISRTSTATGERWHAVKARRNTADIETDADDAE